MNLDQDLDPGILTQILESWPIIFDQDKIL